MYIWPWDMNSKPSCITIDQDTKFDLEFLLLIAYHWHVILSLHKFDINFDFYIFCTQLDSNERN